MRLLDESRDIKKFLTWYQKQQENSERSATARDIHRLCIEKVLMVLEVFTLAAVIGTLIFTGYTFNEMRVQTQAIVKATDAASKQAQESANQTELLRRELEASNAAMLKFDLPYPDVPRRECPVDRRK